MRKAKRTISKKYLDADGRLLSRLGKVSTVIGLDGNKAKEKNRKSKDKGRIDVLNRGVTKTAAYSSVDIGEVKGTNRRWYYNKLDELVREWVNLIPANVRAEMYREYRKGQIMPHWDHEAFVPWYMRIVWSKGVFIVMYPGIKKTFLLYLQKRYGIEFLVDTVGDKDYETVDNWKLPSFPLPKAWMDAREKSMLEQEAEENEPLGKIRELDLTQGYYPFEMVSGWDSKTGKYAGQVNETVADLFKHKMVAVKVRSSETVRPSEMKMAAGPEVVRKGRTVKKVKEVAEIDWELYEAITGK